jgi:hypothetical protein
LLLYTHYRYLHFPFEANSELRKYEGIYRIPSITYLMRNQNKKNNFNCKSLNYLINSNNDLPETESVFYKIKEEFDSWEGIVGKKPTIEEYKNLLRK